MITPTFNAEGKSVVKKFEEENKMISFSNKKWTEGEQSPFFWPSTQCKLFSFTPYVSPHLPTFISIYRENPKISFKMFLNPLVPLVDTRR